MNADFRWLAIPALLLGFAAPLRAGEEKGRQEQQREKEAAAEAQLPGESSQRNPVVRGKLVLLAAPDTETSKVVGWLICDDNRRYQVEVAQEEVLKILKPFHNQVVAVRGHIRDNGATFIVEGVEGAGAPPPAATGRRRRVE